MIDSEVTAGTTPARGNGTESPVRSNELRTECLRAARTRLWVGAVEVEAERAGFRDGLADTADGGPIRDGTEG
jgi:hypothetical protein